jgi:mannose-6-phosphate isomerase-like protein (cupin superfamily)
MATDTRESILRSDAGEISILVATESLSLSYARRAGGERVTDPHTHRHTEAFYVLDGELTFTLGAEAETIAVGAGGFVAVPAGVPHAYSTAGDEPARWLVIHAPDGGFARFLHGMRDKTDVDWDMTPVAGSWHELGTDM